MGRRALLAGMQHRLDVVQVLRLSPCPRRDSSLPLGPAPSGTCRVPTPWPGPSPHAPALRRRGAAERDGMERMWSRTGASRLARALTSSRESGSNRRRLTTSTCPGSTFASSARPASVRVTVMLRSSSGEERGRPGPPSGADPPDRSGHCGCRRHRRPGRSCGDCPSVSPRGGPAAGTAHS